MTIFLAAITAGCERLPVDIERRMALALAPAGKATTFRSGPFASARVDLGFWPGSSVVEASDRWTIVAGDPVLSDPSAQGAISRTEAIEWLASRVQSDDPTALRAVEGTCCGLIFDAAKRHLTAFTDKVGVRPLYWARAEGVSYVASAQWPLEGLGDIALQPDWIACAEIATFGYPLADRTAFLSIRSLEPGHALTAAPGKPIGTQSYWDWDTLTPNPTQGEALVKQIRDAFDAAFAARLRGQKEVIAFLSGGLDSRLIVARLREASVRVSTLNFAPTGSQDLVLGGLAAQALETDHSEFTRGSVTFLTSQRDAIAGWRAERANSASLPDQPGLVWSGDGGSVALGHVYVFEDHVAAAREGGISGSVRAIASGYALTPQLFSHRWKHLAQVSIAGIEADLRSRPNTEPGRNAHMFFMLNDQRRHLVRHFENLHLAGFDMVLPFFDGRFLATVLSSRIDPFLRHKLYNDLMATMKGPIAQVPWQAYPGHLPGPVPVDGKLREQWRDGWHDRATIRRQRGQFLRRWRSNLNWSSFSGGVLSRPKVLASLTAGLAGAHRWSYLVDIADPFVQASAKQRPAVKIDSNSSVPVTASPKQH